MTMPEQNEEKTEQASPKKREDERKKGNIFMSKDITTVVSLVVSFYVISYFIGGFLSQVKENYTLQMSRIVNVDVLGTGEVMNIMTEILVLIGTTALPAMAIIGLVIFLAVGAQTRFLFSYEQIKFKMERIDPIKGFQRLFSLRSLVELVKSLIKIVVLTWILYSNIQKAFFYVPQMLEWDLYQGAVYAGQEILSLVRTTGIAFGAVAALDYLYQRWEYEKNIRMTKQEVKDEYKQMEGNPEIKSARRQKQREYAQRRMMQQVQDADVVVRNPTHFAIALKYSLDEDFAPKVLAKGQDKIAEKIIAEAEKYDIIMVENPPLARSLYELAEVDDYIPAELYQAVAELLAWLYTRAK
ncbi:flagellar biosynthesis protein FlhB [Ruminococcaceae bacterium OttesenSCG-928-L11]|nr:flagellar biosynthesis protein FlhB [Ruminococcaceae bacterium OttesenSCG-928-L11]